LEELRDVFGDWTPMPDEADENMDAALAAADTVTLYDVIPDKEESAGKRKRYARSVGVVSCVPKIPLTHCYLFLRILPWNCGGRLRRNFWKLCSVARV
jgi:hypothetical protein